MVNTELASFAKIVNRSINNSHEKSKPNANMDSSINQGKMDVTFTFNVSGSSQVDLVTDEDDHLLFGARFLPQILDNFFGNFKAVSISDGVDQDEGVRVVSRQAIFNLSFYISNDHWIEINDIGFLLNIHNSWG